MTLTVSDEDGGTATQTTTINVQNIAPTVDLNGPTSGGLNDTITITSTASDPAGTNDPLTYVWSVTRDGVAVDQQSGGTTYLLTATTAGQYIVELTVSDDDGGSTIDSHIVVITGSDNQAPTLDIAAPSSAVRGQAVELVLNATDADPGDQAGPFEYVIDWGERLTGRNDFRRLIAYRSSYLPTNFAV